MTVTKGKQTITFGALSDKTYGDADFQVSATASSGLAVSFVASGNCTIVGAAVHLTGAGSCTITASQAGNATYNAAPDVPQAFSIAKATLTVTVTSRTKTYGDAVTFAGTEFTTSGLVANDAVASVTLASAGAAAPAAVGAYAITPSAATGTGLSNYTIIYHDGSLTVGAKTASVTPNAASKTYGSAEPTLTGTLTGFLAADAVTATYARTTGETVAGSPYAISATLSPAGVLGNYAITYQTASFTIGQATLTVTTPNQTKVYGAALPALTATVTGQRNNDSIAVHTVTTTATASSPVGGYPITTTLSDPGNALGNYTVTTVGNTLTITPAALTITARNRIKGVTQTVTFTGTEFTTSALQSGDAVTSVTLTSLGAPAAATVADSPYDIVPSAAVGAGLDNYTITYANGKLTVDGFPTVNVPANQTAEATAANGATMTFSATATDIVDGTETVGCTPASGSIFALGTTTVTCTATNNVGLSASNTFTVTVHDTTPPVVTVPANLTVEQTLLAGAVATFSSSARDLVDGQLTPTCTPASGSTFVRGANTVACSATDAHGNTGSSTFTVTVQDTIAPVVTYTGNAGSYTVDQTVAIHCAATDSGSGVGSTTCADITGPAYNFTVGSHSYSATATDRAGNVGQASTSFTIVASTTSLQSLVSSFSTNAGVASGLNAKLAAAANASNANARGGQLTAFENQVNAQLGKALTAAQAAILIQLAEALR